MGIQGHHRHEWSHLGNQCERLFLVRGNVQKTQICLILRRPAGNRGRLRIRLQPGIHPNSAMAARICRAIAGWGQMISGFQ